MKNFLKSDLSLRLLSLLAAIILWAILTPNPVKQLDMNVKLNIINESSLSDRGIKLVDKNFPKYANISVKVRKEYADSVKSTDFEVTLDFAKIKNAKDNSVSLDPPVYLGTANLSQDNIKLIKSTIPVTLGKIEENPFRVQIATDGTLKKDYEIYSSTAYPETISLQGLDSEIKSVAAVIAYVDISNLDISKKFKVKYRVYDKKGNEIYEFSNKKNVEVLINIAKRVKVNVETIGIPAKNHLVGNISVTPSSVLITGSTDTLPAYSTINCEPVNIENADRGFQTSSKIILPKGIKLIDASREATVNVTINSIATKDIKLEPSQIGVINQSIDNSLKCTITSGPVSFKLKGSKTAVDSCNVGNINPEIDVVGLDVGEYKLPVKLTLPANVAADQTPTVDIMIEQR